MLRKTAEVRFTDDNRILTAHVVGEIDHRGATGIRNTIDETLISGDFSHLVLDLSGVNFMDSSGLGLILGRYNNAKKYGKGFSVTDPSPSAERILSAAGAGRIINITKQRIK